MLKQKNDLVCESFPVGTLACNCTLLYSASSKKALIIDPGNDYEKLISEVERRGLHPQVLLHTHAHFDHIGESAALKSKWNIPLYLHADDLFLYEHLIEQGQFFGFPMKPPGRIDHFLQDEERFSLDDSLKDFLKTLHTPGHTPGSCCFYSEAFDEPLLLSGDTLFKRSIGRTDFPGGDAQLIQKSIKTRLLTLPEETEVIPGHGPQTVIFQEKKTNPFFSS